MGVCTVLVSDLTGGEYLGVLHTHIPYDVMAPDLREQLSECFDGQAAEVIRRIRHEVNARRICVYPITEALSALPHRAPCIRGETNYVWVGAEGVPRLYHSSLGIHAIVEVGRGTWF